jgi:ribosomal protein S18 acetylase RimI-like enzyme
VALDLIARGAPEPALLEAGRAAGFRPHLRLIRLARAGTPPPPAQPCGAVNVTDALLADSDAVLRLLSEHFDPLVDQLPDESEIRAAVAVGCLRVVRGQDGIGAFLWSERAGLTALVRYWCVAAERRGTGVGAALMRDYFQRTHDCGRHLLWVREDNAPAVSCYEHYGYKADGLIDQVLCRKDE